MMSARLAWLEALDVVGQLDEEHTMIESPQTRARFAQIRMANRGLNPQAFARL